MRAARLIARRQRGGRLYSPHLRQRQNRRLASDDPPAIAGTLPIERRPIGDSWRQVRKICVSYQCALPLMEGATWCGAAPGAACGVPTLWLDGGDEPAHHR